MQAEVLPVQAVRLPTSVETGSSISPDLFPGTKASWSSKDFPPAGITHLEPGIYCLSNDFKTTNSDVLDGTGVVIVQPSGSVNI